MRYGDPKNESVETFFEHKLGSIVKKLPQLSFLSIGQKRIRSLLPKEALGRACFYAKHSISDELEGVQAGQSGVARLMNVSYNRLRALEPSFDIFEVNCEDKTFLDLGR